MAKVIRGYDPYTANTEIFSRMSDDSSVMDGLSDRFGSGVSKTMARMAAVRDRVKNSKTYRRSLASVRKVRNLNREDSILQLTTIDKMQHAPRYMQEYIMTDKVIAGRYNRGGMHAWEDGFSSRNKVANATASNPWYRELNDGLIRSNTDGFYTTQYLDRDKLEDLKMDDKVDILLSTKILSERVLVGGEDWSSQYCEVI